MDIYFACKYTPIELIEAYGQVAVPLSFETASFETAEAKTSPNICGYAKSLIEFALSGKVRALVLTTCCDAMRRTYDVLKHEVEKDDSPLEFVYLLDLPHDGAALSAQRYARELEKFVDAMQSYLGASLDSKKLLLAWEKASEAVSWRRAHRASSHRGNSPQEGPLKDASQKESVFLIGAHATPSLLQLGDAVFGDALENLTCSGQRLLPPPSRDIFRESPKRTCKQPCEQNEHANTSDSLMLAYAKALLAQTPCFRMVDVERREGFLRQRLAGIKAKGCLFHTMKFCDFYGFEHAQHAKDLKTPVLKIETEGTPQSTGQIKTRLEAFAESVGLTTGSSAKEKSMGFSKRNKESRSPLHSRSGSTTATSAYSSAHNAHIEADVSASAEATANNGSLSNAPCYVMGIDSGSTSTDAVVVDSKGTIIASTIVPTGANALKSAQAAYDDVLKKAHLAPRDISFCVGTGYGRDALPHTNCTITEITCHAKGAHALVPETRTIIDIGGQDSKVIQIDEDGRVETFAMNDKCAAGTGRFIEALARTMQLELDEFAKAGLAWKPGTSQDVVISSMCTVFAESEVISLVANNVDTVDIIHGLNKSVAQKTASLTKRVKATGPYLMTGGVAQNIGVVRALEEVLGQPVTTAPEAQIAGAYGAALLGLERIAQGS